MQVTLKQAFEYIRVLGSTNTFFLQGQPGIGKSAMFKDLARAFPDYTHSLIDASQLDLGDVAMPVVDRERMVTNYAPNARFGLSRGSERPVLVFIDELSKAPGPVMNMLWPLIHEKRLGDIQAHPASIIVANGNLQTDGVGDKIPAQGYNRMTVLDVANPTADEWIEWAVENDVDPAVIKFAYDNPEIFERYDALTNAKNPYVFNPLTGNVRSYCTPRSLERASHIVKARVRLGDILPALAGTIGEPAARLLEASVLLDDRLTPLALIESNPQGADIPKDVGAYFLMAFKLATKANAQNLTAFCKYVERWESFEAIHLFVATLCAAKSKLPIIATCRAFTELSAKHSKYVK